MKRKKREEKKEQTHIIFRVHEFEKEEKMPKIKENQQTNETP